MRLVLSVPEGESYKTAKGHACFELGQVAWSLLCNRKVLERAPHQSGHDCSLSDIDFGEGLR